MGLLIPGVGIVNASGTVLIPGAGVATVSVPPTITTTSLTALQVGVAFSQQLAATGDAPITWTGTVPDGLTLSSSGMLSGTPTTAGAYSFTVTATNAAGSDDQAYSGTIVVAVPVITTTDLGTLTVGTPYSLQLVATGGEPITWSVTSYTADGDTYTVDSATWTADNTTGLPPGLSLSSSGVLSGTPTLAGSYSFTITATNAGGSDADVFAGTVEAAAVTGTVVVGPGGSGYPVYWQGKRRKRRLEEQPNLHLKKVLNDVVNELYGELTEDDVPPAVQAKAAKLVKPFVAKKSKTLAIPPESAVDWVALEKDAARVRQLIALWRKHELEVEIDAEDEYLLMIA